MILGRTRMKVDVMEDGYNDYDLFSLSSIKAKKDLQFVVSPTQSNDKNDIVSEDGANNPNQPVSKDDKVGDIDSDENKRRYDQQLEAGMIDLMRNLFNI